MVKKKVPVVSIVLYVLAGLLVIFSIWSFVFVSQYLKSQGAIFKGNEYTFFNYYMTNAVLYDIYAAVLFALGWIIQKVTPVAEKVSPEFENQEAYVPDGAFAEEIQEAEVQGESTENNQDTLQ